MTKTIFEEEWFSWHSLAGLRAALHKTDKLREHEQILVTKLLSKLLYQIDEVPHLKEAVDFFSYAAIHRGESFAQISQDLWVLVMSQQKRDGYFVEFGACDGVLLSNTLLLEREFGWQGILAEPNPVWHPALRDNRTCHISEMCVHANSNEVVTFQAVTEMPELSRVSSIVPSDVHEKNGNRAGHRLCNVATISLVDLLREYHAPHRIDYLSLDTEGSEFEILNAFDFSEFTFQHITVEHAGEPAKREAIRSLLEANGYERWFPEFSRWDDWYVHRTNS